MFVNLDEMQFILLKLTVGSKEIQVVPSFDVSGVTNDDKLNFNVHIDRIFKSASNELNALLRLKKCLDLWKENL